MKANSETNLKKKYNSVEEIREHKKELLEKFEGELPSYLSEYFDEQELRQIKREYYEKNVKDKNWDDIAEYWKKTEEEFWKNNKTRIVKRPKKVGHHLKPVYKEPHRATERVEQERELTEQERLALRALCEKDLYLFAVRYFPHYLKKPSSKFHKYLYKTLQYEINNKKRRRGLKLAIAAPRSNSKSSIISGIFPIWCICYQKKRFIIMISDTAGQAQDFLADIKRELEFNDKLIADFPHVCGKGPTWRLDEIVTKNGVKVLALGTGSKIRGRKFGVYRPSLVICDDLESGDMIRSPTTREFIRYQWFDKDLMFAGGEEGTSTDFIVVGTILGKDSLLHALTDPSQYPEWTSVRFSAVEQFSDSPLWDEWASLYKNKFDDKRKETAYKFFLDHKDEMLKGTRVLWPEGDPYYDLMIWKYMSPSAFACFDAKTPIVLSDHNFKYIKDINIGDKILSGDCTPQDVIDVGINELGDRELYSVKIAGFDQRIVVTEDHPWLVYPKLVIKNITVTHQHLGKVRCGSGKISKRADSRILNNKLLWKQTKDLQVGDSLVFPVDSSIENCVYHDPEWYFLVGLWIAEGSLTAGKRAVSFDMHCDEVDHLQRVRDYYGKGTINVFNNQSRLIISSTNLANKLSVFGNKSSNKNITPLLYKLCKECFMSLLEGIITGDGYLTHKRSYRSINSASYLLLWQLHSYLLKFGLVSYLYKLRDTGQCTIENRNYVQQPLYQLALVYERDKEARPLQSWVYQDKLYSKIQSISKINAPNNHRVYWMSVTGNKTYCIPFATVANSEKQNDPYDPTKILVTRDQLHFEDFRRNEKIQGILKNARYFGALDPSLGKKGGDYSCICTLARDPKTGFVFVVDFFLKRASVDDQINAILALHQKYKYIRFAVEVNAFQLVVADALRKKSRELGFYVPIQEIKNYSDKKMRFEGIIPHLTDGTIVFDLNKERQSQQYSMAIEQITTFTGEELTRDDGPDALEMAFQIAKKPKFRRLYRLTKEI